jgi:hypothetical protein
VRVPRRAGRGHAPFGSTSSITLSISSLLKPTCRPRPRVQFGLLWPARRRASLRLPCPSWYNRRHESVRRPIRSGRARLVRPHQHEHRLELRACRKCCPWAHPMRNGGRGTGTLLSPCMHARRQATRLSSCIATKGRTVQLAIHVVVKEIEQEAAQSVVGFHGR